MKKTQTALLEDSKTGAAKKGLKPTSSKQDVADMSQPDPEGRGLFLSIYKNKVEPLNIHCHVRCLISVGRLGISGAASDIYIQVLRNQGCRP